MSDRDDLSQYREKPFRDEYMETYVRSMICYQIQALREQLEMTQTEFARKVGKPQSVISRLENVERSRASVQSLLDIACALDIALLVKFVSYPEFLRLTSDVSPEGLRAESFDESLERQAKKRPDVQLEQFQSLPIKEEASRPFLIAGSAANTNHAGIEKWLSNSPTALMSLKAGLDQSFSGTTTPTVARYG